MEHYTRVLFLDNLLPPLFTITLLLLCTTTAIRWDEMECTFSFTCSELEQPVSQSVSVLCGLNENTRTDKKGLQLQLVVSVTEGAIEKVGCKCGEMMMIMIMV